MRGRVISGHYAGQEFELMSTVFSLPGWCVVRLRDGDDCVIRDVRIATLQFERIERLLSAPTLPSAPILPAKGFQTSP